MISRRNIRVKVMQTLYAGYAIEGKMKKEDAIKTLDKHLEQSLQLFVFLIYNLTEIARYAEIDARQKASKHLPTQQDLVVNTKIAGNLLLWQILEHPTYNEAIKAFKIDLKSDQDWIRKLYLELIETDFYKKYISLPSRDKKDEKEILEFIFTDLMLPNDDFVAYLEEYFVHWEDDCEMMNLLLLNFLQKPNTNNFRQFVSAEKLKFAKDLLSSVIDKEEICNEYIKSKLQNWDPERTAIIDMILMRMGICEFLYFETIPTKVTINEYIELAKDYSTPQSGHFVNGILDSIHKDLLAENKLHKISFKKS